MDKAQKRRFRPEGLLLGALALLAAVLCIVYFRQIAQAVGLFADYLSRGFIRRALVAGLSVSLCAALLGVCLVLKRYSMIGDGLSHVGFGALAVAMSLGYVAQSSPFYGLCRGISAHPVAFTTVVVMVLAILLLRINGSSRIKGDAAIALLSTGALALGVIVISTTEGMNIDIFNYMFGSILSVGKGDVWFALGMCAVVTAAFVLSYPRLFAVTFDETFARSGGVPAGAYNLLLAVLTAVTVVMGMRLMGTMLISSLIIFPALTAMRVFSRFRQVVVCAAVVSTVCFLVGLMLSCVYSLPTGAAVVGVNVLAFGLFTLIGRARGAR